MAIAKKTLTQMVYDYVYEAIVNAELDGSEIITESRVAEELNVSKAPVREALLMLCQENILQSVPRTGYLITRITPAQVSKLVEARLLLEPRMLEMGWSHIGPGQVQDMVDFHVGLNTEENMRGSILNRWKDNIAFHIKLAGYCENDYLIEMLRQLLRTSARAATQCFLGYRASGHEASYHDMIIEALKVSDLDAARSALISDIGEIK